MSTISAINIVKIQRMLRIVRKFKTVNHAL